MRNHLIIHAKPMAKLHIEAGKHRFVNLIRHTFEKRGYSFSTAGVSGKDRLLARFGNGYHMFDIDGPQAPNS